MKKKQTKQSTSNSKLIQNSTLIINNQFIALILIVLFFFLFFNYSKYMPFSLNIFLDFFKIGSSKITEISLSLLLPHITRILWLIFIYISGLGFGSTILNIFKLNKSNIGKSEYNIFTIGLGLFNLIIMTFIIGICGFLYKPVILTLLILGCILFLINFKSFIPKSPYLSEKSKTSFFDKIFEKIFILFSITAIIYIIPSVFIPETFYDSLIGHLGIPYKWILAHKIYSTPFNSTADMPFNINMLYTIALILKDEILAKIIHFSFLLTIIYAIFSFIKKFISKKKSTAFFAIAILLTSPIIMMMSIRSGIELGLVFFEFLAMFALINYTKSDEPGIKLKWLVIAGIMNGVSLGAKYTSFMSYFSMAAVIFSYNIFLSEKSNKTKALQIAIKDTVIFCLIAGIVASPWYIRNLLTWHNPFVPFAKSLGVSNTDRMLNLVDPPKIVWTLKKIILFPWYMTNGSLQQESMPGFLYIFMLPLVFFVKIKSLKTEIKIFNLYTAIYMIFALTIGNGYMRYFLPIFPILAIIFAYYSTEKDNLIKQTILIFSIPIMILNLSSAITLIKENTNPLKNFLGLETNSKYLSTVRATYPGPYFDAADWINKNTPKNSVILNIGETRNFYIQRQVINHNIANTVPVVEFLKKAKNTEDFIKILKRQKINYILLNTPEVMRLKGFDILYWNKNQFEIFIDFFENYTKEVYKFAPDVEMKDNLLLSQTDYWKKYIANPLDFVYVYEISYTKLPNEIIKKFNPFILKYLYTDERQKELNILS